MADIGKSSGASASALAQDGGESSDDEGPPPLEDAEPSKKA
jgi:hypothetical protein